MSLCRASRLLVCLLVCLAFIVTGQQISGTITGAVKDSQMAAISSAKIILVNREQGTTRETQTLTDGTFVLTQLQPGTYTLTVEFTGFKKFEQTDIRVFASDRIALGDLVMTVGGLNETVTVEAAAAQIQTASAERSGVLTTRQVLDVGLLSRSLFDLARTLPGITTGNSTSGLGVGSINANGNRSNQNNFTLDGVTNMDTGSNGGTLASTNVDMIAEMKVITNSQPAEFGRSSGAQIQVVTKSGGKDFHGTGYWFHRHEGLNANTWRNNIDNRSRPLYRYNYQGFNVGGPVLMPGGFNKERDKLFFFVGIEWQEQLVPNSLRSVTVPTALERKGDFSQTHDSAGFAPNIRDLGPAEQSRAIPRKRHSHQSSEPGRHEDPELVSDAEYSERRPRFQLPDPGVQPVSPPGEHLPRRLQHQREVEDLRSLYQDGRPDQHGVRPVERGLQHSTRAHELRRSRMVLCVERDHDHQPHADE
jgi:outer membrane receptor protein involved in Fe transport